MKNSTKRKIIEWVTKILKYYPPMVVECDREEVKIHRVFVSTESRIVTQSLMVPYLLRELSIELQNQNLLIFNEENLTPGLKIYTVELEVIKRKNDVKS